MSKKYSYNDVVLPELPEDVLVNYPYIVIVRDGITGGCIMNASTVPSERFYSYQTSAGGYTITHELDGLGYPGRGVYGTNAGDTWTISAELSSESALVGPPGYWGYDTLANADGEELSTIVWSNHDIYDTYGVLYYTASDDPIPVIEGFDIRSWCIGYALGLAGKPLPLGVGGKTPATYLYNGVQLPALPEWDKDAYPYVFIARSWNKSYSLVVAQTPAYVYTGRTSEVIEWNVPCMRCSYYNNTGWSDLRESTTSNNIAMEDEPFVWANHDIKKNGEMWLAASEPIPVYE